MGLGLICVHATLVFGDSLAEIVKIFQVNDSFCPLCILVYYQLCLINTDDIGGLLLPFIMSLG